MESVLCRRPDCSESSKVKGLCYKHYRRVWEGVEDENGLRLTPERMESPSVVIYALFDNREPDLIRYVGLTGTTLAKRLYRHKAAMRDPRKKWKALAWMRSIGEENIGCKVLEFGNSPQSLGPLEVYWIAKLRREGHPLENSNTGGSHPVLTDETRARFSQVHKGKKITRTPERLAEIKAFWADGRIKGSGHPNAHYSEDQVLQIRADLAAGSTSKSLALKWGVSIGAIQDIKHRRSWTHI